MRHVTATSIVNAGSCVVKNGGKGVKPARRLCLGIKSTSRRLGQSLQKSNQIVCDMIDVWRVAAFELPAFPKYFAGVLGHDQHRGHAERTREVFREGWELEGRDAPHV